MQDPIKTTIACIVTLIVLIPGIAFGQVGTIAGTVVDEDNGETIIGANVFLEGTTIGTSTDIEGRYRIEKVPTGTYSLVFSYIGFQKLTIQSVLVVEGSVVTFDIALKADAVALDEVVVEAHSVANNEAALLKDRQRSLAVSDAISAEAISKSGSSDAADVMEKVTGASVVGGKYVYVRGLGERYSSTHLNGVELPTADPDKKAVQFDLFPSNLLDNIVTIKTFTPDKPGNFSGGLVDIGTKAFPEELNVKLSISSSLNSQTHFTSDFLTYRGGDMDWLAVDDGTRSIPEILNGSDISIPTIQSARRDAVLANELDAFSKAFNNVMAPISGNANINSSYSFSVGNQKTLAKKPLGFILGITYSNNASFYDGGQTGRYSFTGSQLATDLALDDARSTQEVSWGGLGNITYKFTPNHEIGLNSVYSRSAESMARIQQGLWPKENLNDSTAIRTNRFLAYTERQMMSGQLRGKHFFKNMLGSTVEWTVSGSRTEQDEPDRRVFISNQRTIGQNVINSVTSSGFSEPSRYFRNLDEESTNAKLDLSVPFKNWTGRQAKLKMGGAAQHSNRDFRERIFAIAPSTDIGFHGDASDFFGPHNMGIVDFDSSRNQYIFGHTVRDQTKERNNYDGRRQIYAGYGMLELPVFGSLKLISGARIETTLIEIVSRDSTLDKGSIDKIDILPSVNLVYGITNEMNLRAAYSNTLARPTFREISPFASFDFDAGDFRIGNPTLDRTRISNYDVRWEWFMAPGEIFAMSLFYKDMVNPIEEAIVGGTNGQLQYQNVDQATVAGAEFELRKRLGFLATAVRNFSIGVNVSLVHSNVDIAETELAARQEIDSTASATRQLQGQSPYIVNADFSYDNLRSGTTAALYFNVFGERLSNVSLGGTPDVFEQPSPQLDFTFSQRLPGNWSAKISAKNILNSAFRMSHSFDGQEFIYQEYTRGRKFSIGVAYSP